MEDMNACALCGFTSADIIAFTEHVEQHENERIITNHNIDNHINTSDISQVIFIFILNL